ncbi:N-6 DNA methylase, partial [Fervidicoccus fontis]
MKARILKKLGIEPVNNESFQIFIASIKTIMEYAGDVESLANWNAPILSDLNKLSSSEIELIKSEVQNTNLSIKECQVEVQKLIPQEKRKKFAVYYTIQQGTDLMTSIVKEFLSSRKEKVVLVDPFLGSGSTLTAAIEKIGVEKVEKVWGIEPLPLPALVAYVSLLHSMNGKRDAVTVILGDAFEEIPKMFSPPFVQSKLPKADIILTNPPFTRWKYLEKKYREHILSVIEKLGYKKYITRKEVSLQTLSMFLCDRILNNNGLLISVLPASTFYTIYGRGYKSLLKEKYGIYAMVESKSRVSFSEDSGFKEIIIVAVKGSNKKLTA